MNITLSPPKGKTTTSPLVHSNSEQTQVPLQLRAITSLYDASGESGSDYVVEGGRGAVFGALLGGTVTKVRPRPVEYHLEKGDRRRSYGNYVEVQSTTPYGPASLLYAHLDEILVSEGQQLKASQAIGTQGRTGSTTGAHVSVDARVIRKTGTNRGQAAKAKKWLLATMRGILLHAKDLRQKADS